MSQENLKRGEIWLCNLKHRIGPEQKGIRPVLIVLDHTLSYDDENRTVVLPFTTKKINKLFPTHVFVEAGTGNIPKDSIVMAEQVASVPLSYLINKIGFIEPESPIMQKIEKAMRISFLQD